MRKTILILLLSNTTLSQYVYTQLYDNLYFSPTTPQLRITASLNPNLAATQQYTMWGWFKFNGLAAAISNIFSLRLPQPSQNITKTTQTTTTGTTVGPYPNPAFPDCPVTQQQLAQNPSLATQTNIQNNPNCFPTTINNIPTQQQPLKGPDLLYVNFDYSLQTNGTETFSLIYLLQISVNQTNQKSDMMLQGFLDLPLERNIWNYFAISCDYSAGTVQIYFKPFNSFSAGTNTAGVPYNGSKGLSKSFHINYPQFSLTPGSELVIAGVENNPFFQSTSGFIGNIAYLEIGLFYTTELESLWTGFMNPTQLQSRGILLDFPFDVYIQNGVVNALGINPGKFSTIGNVVPIYLLNNNQIGLQFRLNSQLNLGNQDFGNQNQLTQNFVFYLQFDFTSDISNDTIILQRGIANQNGSIQIILSGIQSSKKIVLVTNHQNQQFVWTSPFNLQALTKTKLIIGLSINPAKTASVVYWDGFGNIYIGSLADNFNFNVTPQTITLYGPGNSATFANAFNSTNSNTNTATQNSNSNNNISPNINYYRFTMLDSSSPVIYNLILSSNVNYQSYLKDNIDTNTLTVPPNFAQALQNNTSLRTSFYGQDFGSLICNPRFSVATQNRTCIQFCPLGTKNAQSDLCVNCYKPNCSELDSLTYTIQRINDTYYRIYPSKPLLFGSQNYSDLFAIQIQGLNSTDYNATLYPNLTGQYFDLNIDVNKTVYSQPLSLTINPNYVSGVKSGQLLDTNRNLLYNSTAVYNLQSICVVSAQRSQILKILAIFVFCFFVFTFIFLISCTACCYSKLHYLGGLWKYFLNCWMKLQFVALLALLGFLVPCCIRGFLDILYTFVISWNHAMYNPINQLNISNQNYVQGMVLYSPPISFSSHGASSFFLHNMAIAFIIHCFIFLAYIFCKIWDCVANISANCLYKFFIFMEFTIPVVFYLLFDYQAFVFLGLNLVTPLFSHSFFVFCYIISICYLLVFVIFLGFTGVQLICRSQYFLDPIKYNAFYYFLVGYREDKPSRTYDFWLLLSHLIIGLVIGIIPTQPLTQLIIILVVLVIFLIISLAIRPWESLIILIFDIFSQILLICAIGVLLGIAVFQNNGCVTCDQREGIFCFSVVALLFASLIIAFLGLFLATIFEYFGICSTRQAPEIIRNKFQQTIEANTIIQTNQLNSIDDTKREFLMKENNTLNNTAYDIRGYNENGVGMMPGQMDTYQYQNNIMNTNGIVSNQNLAFNPINPSGVVLQNFNNNLQRNNENLLIVDQQKDYLKNNIQSNFNNNMNQFKTVLQNNEKVELELKSDNQTMDQFMNQIKNQESKQEFGLNLNNYSNTGKLQTDNADEQGIQNAIIRTFTANSINEIPDNDIERKEFNDRKNFVQQKKEQFYKERQSQNIPVQRITMSNNYFGSQNLDRTSIGQKFGQNENELLKEDPNDLSLMKNNISGFDYDRENIQPNFDSNQKNTLIRSEFNLLTF